MNVKKIARLGLLTAIALTIFLLEAQIPPLVPIPGVKLGLANIVTVFTVFTMGPAAGAEVLFARIFLGSVFGGNFGAILYSAAGGALAIGVANRVYMLENSVYSILSPEGFSSILWGDSGMKEKACEVMKLTAADLKEFGVIDGIVREPKGGAHRRPSVVFKALDELLYRDIKQLRGKSGNELARSRYQKFRKIDERYMEGADS